MHWNFKLLNSLNSKDNSASHFKGSEVQTLLSPLPPQRKKKLKSETFVYYFQNHEKLLVSLTTIWIKSQKAYTQITSMPYLLFLLITEDEKGQPSAWGSFPPSGVGSKEDKCT